MYRRTLNLGILAHVDAGKTSLTERLLYAAGVIDAVGSVDDGTTQTDSLALERQRGITIRSAVTSFAIDDVTVNLIDTPGHPDFIAEVERVLSVLDGAVLVVSAVEGVQPQTRVLMRTLRRLRIPTLLFVNKIDRSGADTGRVLRAIAERLTPAVVAMGSASGQGTREAGVDVPGADDVAARVDLAEVLAEHDDELLAAYVADEAGIPYRRLREALAEQTRRGLVHPVFLGSAVTGVGVPELSAGLVELLPVAAGDAEGPVAGRVFKIERGPNSEKVAYLRMFSGTVHVRGRVGFGGDRSEKVTAIRVFERGPAVPRASVSAGEIGALRGLADVQVGDRIGDHAAGEAEHYFAPPTLESVVVADDPADRAKLRTALGQLAEQDPMIDVRQDDAVGETSVSLYGEVQKEVIQATLANEYGVGVTFRETTTIYVERPVGTGAAVEVLGADGNPFMATVGLRVEPAPPESGVEFRLEADLRSVPMYVYKTTDSFVTMMTQYVREALREGRYGWRVTDCVVTMVECGYVPPSTTAADYRKLTPLVLMAALEQAGTTVCEPMVRASIEVPAVTVGAVLGEVAKLGGNVTTSTLHGDLAVVRTLLPAARARDLQRHLPGLTSGEGVAETTFGGYRRTAGDPPARHRTIRGHHRGHHHHDPSRGHHHPSRGHHHPSRGNDHVMQTNPYFTRHAELDK